MTRTTLLPAFLLVLFAGCEGRLSESDPVEPSADAELRRDIAQWGVIPIGPMPDQGAARVALGRALFFDRILSGNRDVSCATCHDPTAALGDGLSLAVGTGGSGHASARRLGAGRVFVNRQSPTLLNSGLGTPYVFWDGRLSGRAGAFINETGIGLPNQLPSALTAQAMLPVLNRREMRGEPGDRDVFGQPNELAAFTDAQSVETWQAVMKRLLAIPEYVQLFSVAFPAKHVSTLTFEDAAAALAAFQMAEFTKVRAPFDRYLDRDDGALTAEQKRGAQLFFRTARCASCHNGPMLGGQGFANVGVPQIGPGARLQPPLDMGRGELSQQHQVYRFAFRVAPLRNVELTAPYMHNGAYPTLEAVLRHYNDVPLALRTYDVTQLSPELRPLYHGESTTIDQVMTTLDGRLRSGLNLSETERNEIIAFLKALTDPAARNLAGLTPSRVPSGLPVQ